MFKAVNMDELEEGATEREEENEASDAARAKVRPQYFHEEIVGQIR